MPKFKSKSQARRINSQLKQFFCDIALKEGFSEGDEVEVLTTSKQYVGRYGDFQFAESDLKEIAKNFNSGVLGREVPVDENHEPNHRAFAWVQPGSARVGEATSGNGAKSLFVKLYRFTSDGRKILQEGVYRYFSVELRNAYTLIVNGAKKKFNNILFALALTNTPAVKGMAPTFSEENIINPSVMGIKAMIARLSEKKFVSKDEKDLLKDAFTALSEEEQEEVKEDVEEINEKPEAEEKKPADGGGEDEDGEEDGNEDEDEDEDKKLSEEIVALNERVAKAEKAAKAEKEKNFKLAEKIRRQEVEKEAADYILSEDNTVGVAGENAQSEVTDFLMTLSEGQRKQFDKLFGQIRSVDLSEYGHSNSEVALSEDAQEKKAKKLARKLQAENQKLSEWEALDQAYEELGMKQD